MREICAAAAALQATPCSPPRPAPSCRPQANGGEACTAWALLPLLAPLTRASRTPLTEALTTISEADEDVLLPAAGTNDTTPWTDAAPPAPGPAGPTGPRTPAQRRRIYFRLAEQGVSCLFCNAADTPFLRVPNEDPPFYHGHASRSLSAVWHSARRVTTLRLLQCTYKRRLAARCLASWAQSAVRVQQDVPPPSSSLRRCTFLGEPNDRYALTARTVLR